MRAPAGRWNHNTHFHPLALRHAAGARSALDVGCGDGLLSRRLVDAGAASAVGIDADAGQIGLAREQAGGDDRFTFLHGDALRLPERERFDLVTCFATLHHLGLEAGLRRLAELTAPGGHLVVVGLASARSPRELLTDLATVPVAAVTHRVRGVWEHGAPVSDPDHSYGTVRRAAATVLPGARFRQRLYWRYSLEWTAPVGA
jgi:2-polyprenyl-3-methyl-5-hydroxy-6-metoxy-1,4-benzoquinol methylase